MPGNHGIWTKAYGPFQPPRFGAAPPVHAEARSTDNDRPAGVVNSCQVVRYKIEPPKAVFARNLLPNNDVRTVVLDDPVPVRPKVPLIIKPCAAARSEEHTSELQSLMRISYAVFCLKKKSTKYNTTHKTPLV